MIEQAERLLQTSRPHKATDFLSKADYYGMIASICEMPSHSPERGDVCGVVTGIQKVNDFAEQQYEVIERMYAPEEKVKVLVAVDTAGYIGVNQLMTCRGRGSAVDKLHETLQLLHLNSTPEGDGQINYINSVGHGQRDRGLTELHDVGVRVSSAQLTLSSSLLKLLASDDGIKLCDRVSRWQRVGRPIINPNSNGAIDMTALTYAVRSTGNKEIKMIWRNGFGQQWEINGVHVERGMRDDMNGILRGMPWSTVKYLAELPC